MSPWYTTTFYKPVTCIPTQFPISQKCNNNNSKTIEKQTEIIEKKQSKQKSTKENLSTENKEIDEKAKFITEETPPPPNQTDLK